VARLFANHPPLHGGEHVLDTDATSQPLPTNLGIVIDVAPNVLTGVPLGLKAVKKEKKCLGRRL
jgi:hypothetical protein